MVNKIKKKNVLGFLKKQESENSNQLITLLRW